jgi:hypothetical protein
MVVERGPQPKKVTAFSTASKDRGSPAGGWTLRFVVGTLATGTMTAGMLIVFESIVWHPVILVNPFLDENVGSVARAMMNAGLTELRLGK